MFDLRNIERPPTDLRGPDNNIRDPRNQPGINMGCHSPNFICDDCINYQLQWAPRVELCIQLPLHLAPTIIVYIDRDSYALQHY